MEQRLNMVMVAARDIVGLRSFYEAGLGWATWGPVSPHSVLYKLGTAILDGRAERGGQVRE